MQGNIQGQNNFNNLSLDNYKVNLQYVGQFDNTNTKGYSTTLNYFTSTSYNDINCPHFYEYEGNFYAHLYGKYTTKYDSSTKKWLSLTGVRFSGNSLVIGCKDNFQYIQEIDTNTYVLNGLYKNDLINDSYETLYSSFYSVTNSTSYHYYVSSLMYNDKIYYITTDTDKQNVYYTVIDVSNGVSVVHPTNKQVTSSGTSVSSSTSFNSLCPYSSFIVENKYLVLVNYSVSTVFYKDITQDNNVMDYIKSPFQSNESLTQCKNALVRLIRLKTTDSNLYLNRGLFIPSLNCGILSNETFLDEQDFAEEDADHTSGVVVRW